MFRPAALAHCIPLLLPALLACSGEEAGSSARPTGNSESPITFPLPPGVYEVRVALEYDPGDADWTLPLPDTVDARLVVSAPVADEQELNFFNVDSLEWDGGPAMADRDQVWIERTPNLQIPDYLHLLAVPVAGPCRRAVSLSATELSFSARDADRDGNPDTIEATLAGTATEEVPFASNRTHEPTRPFRGHLVASADRTPPAIVPAADAVSPWGPYVVRFSEPVLFDDVDLALATGDASVPVITSVYPLPSDSSSDRVTSWDAPLLDLPLFQDGPSLAHLALPPGAPVRLERLRVRDLAGNVLHAGPVDTGLRVVAPEGRPADSFEDGALAGWVTTGDVRAIRSTAELSAIDGDFVVTGPLAGFSLFARIDVPDTEAPSLELAAGAVPGQWQPGGPLLEITAGDADLLMDGALALPAWPAEPGRIDLSPLRGRTVTLRLAPASLDLCREARDGVVVLDSFRIVP